MQHDRGSTLLPVLASVVILTVMLSTLMTISARDLQETNQTVARTGNLLDLRSALQAVYNQLNTQWSAIAPNGSVADVAAAKKDLASVAAGVQSWCDSAFQGTNIQATIAPQSNNFETIDSTSESTYHLYQNYLITIHGSKGNVSQTMTDTVTISGAVEPLNYALYAPGNIVMTGSPEVDGRVAAGDSIYFDSTPWEGIVSDGRASTYVTYEGRPIYFYPIPSGYEPADLPLLGGNAGIASKNGLFGFTQFTDQWSPGWPSVEFGNGLQVKDKQPISTSQLPNYVKGNLLASTDVPSLGTDYVKNIIASADKTIKTSAQAVEKQGYGQFKTDGGFAEEGGYFHYPEGHDPYVLMSDDTVNGPIYFDGDLTIASNTTLTLSQPLFVTGDLTINGVLNSSAAIYVGGQTTITNVPPDTAGGTPNRLEIFGDGNMVLAFLSQGRVGPANTVTTFHAFLASNTNVYLEGMDSFYKIIGGVSGANLILNATEGANQVVSGTYLRSSNPNDLTRRLWIAYDNSYVSNPLTGTPTVNQLKLQDLPLPYVTSE